MCKKVTEKFKYLHFSNKKGERIEEGKNMRSVLVLMSTFNGERFLDEQLESIFNQEGVDVSLLVRDDGSIDRTIDILNDWKKRHPISIILGKNIGYACSFMTLVNVCGDADYYAFADQDDVWKQDKLIHAVNQMGTDPGHEDMPILYMSQADIVDINLDRIKTKFHKRVIKVDTLVAHNFAIGCTMVFNKTLKNILAMEIGEMELRAGHDYWCSCVAAAVDSKIIWDEEGRILYRQHGKNASGKIVSFKQAAIAVKKILVKWKNVRSSIAEKILNSYGIFLSCETRELLMLAVTYRSSIKDYLKMMFSRDYMSSYLAVDLVVKISFLLRIF